MSEQFSGYQGLSVPFDRSEVCVFRIAGRGPPEEVECRVPDRPEASGQDLLLCRVECTYDESRRCEQLSAPLEPMN